MKQEKHSTEMLITCERMTKIIYKLLKYGFGEDEIETTVKFEVERVHFGT